MLKKIRMVWPLLLALIFSLTACHSGEEKKQTPKDSISTGINEEMNKTEDVTDTEEKEEMPLTPLTEATKKEKDEHMPISDEQVVDFIALKLKTPIVFDAAMMNVFDGIPYVYDCTYYYDGQRLRIDIWGPAGEQHFIQDEKEDKAYLMDFVRNRALPIVGEELIPGMYFYKDVYLREIDPKGENNIVTYQKKEGQETFHIEIQGEEGEHTEIVLDMASGLPLKYVISYYGNPQIEIETKNIRLEETLTDEKFILPKEMEIVDIDKWLEAE